MENPEKLISIYECGTNVEAAMIRDRLESAGIPCMLTNETFSSIYPISHSTLGGIRVLIFQRDIKAAQEILQNKL